MSLHRLPVRGVFIVALLAAPASFAQDSSAALEAELDRIYQQLLVDPADRVLNRRMIDIAVRLGDYDAAIGAAERLLFYDPDNAHLQVEVARLYMEIDSHAAAAGYLQEALALPGLSGGQREEAEALLVLAERKTTPSPWSGFGQVGMRYQTNANHGSVALGLDEPFPFDKPVADWNSFALGTLGLSLPVGEGFVFEATVSGYYADQQKVDRLDLGFAEATVGPRYTGEGGALSLKPYAIVQGILLGEAAYQSAVGAGLLARWAFADGWWVEPQVEYKARTYYSSDDYPQAKDQTGDLVTYSLAMSGSISDSLGWSSRLAYSENSAAAAYQSYDQYALMLGLDFGFDLWGLDDWLLTAFVGGTFTDFRGIAPPERYAGLDTRRRDELWTVGANIEVPWREQVAFGVAVEYSQNFSNLDRNDYENLKVIMGPQGRF